MPLKSRSRSRISASACCSWLIGSPVGFKVTVILAVCSPDSLSETLVRSTPATVEIFSTSGSLRIICSIGEMIWAVVSTGVPIGRVSSTLNSPWCTSGISSLPRRGASTATQIRKGMIESIITEVLLASAQSMMEGYKLLARL